TNMIIDVRTYSWTNLDQLGRHMADRLMDRQGERWTPVDASATAHERAMGCVDGALVMGFRSERLGARIPNELVAEFVGKAPQKRAGIAGIDPTSADAMDEIRRAAGMGLVGVSVSPSCQGFHPAHSSAMRLYDECVKRGMPVFISGLDPLTAGAEMEFGRPGLWDEVARSFPELRIVVSQLGHPWVDETLVLLSKHHHVYADISGVASRPWQLYNALLSATSFGVMDKLLFASGFPYEVPSKTIETMYSVNAFAHGTQLPTVPRAQIRGIVERNAAECLGIETGFAASEASRIAAGGGASGESREMEWEILLRNEARGTRQNS
ncbi:MAG TPA: amidohydrolase family protein, partial [Phycisphaerales bacterium]|nr:amidohydrolase family protein [Phycisphaerales bacterium]